MTAHRVEQSTCARFLRVGECASSISAAECTADRFDEEILGRVEYPQPCGDIRQRFPASFQLRNSCFELAPGANLIANVADLPSTAQIKRR
jgi:hypothetical protein